MQKKCPFFRPVISKRDVLLCLRVFSARYLFLTENHHTTSGTGPGRVGLFAEFEKNSPAAFLPRLR
jgi:hypothetical protein